MLTLLKPFGSPKKEAALLSGVVNVAGLGLSHGEKFLDRIKTCDILQGDIEVMVTEALLSRAQRLRAVVCRSIGVDFVDVEAATKRRILVLNSPDYCVNAVAEHVAGLMFALARGIPYAVRATREGHWEARGKLRCLELQGKTLGIVGFGKIGRRVAALARGLGMNVVAADPFVSPEAAGEAGAVLLPLEELLPKSDVLTVHLPLTRESRGLIGDRELSLLHEGALVINVARGGIVDEEALARALTAGRLGGAAVDVYTAEPPGGDHVLIRTEHPNLLTTPHMAWNSDNARRTNDQVFLGQITDLATGRVPKHVVNPEAAAAWSDRFASGK